MPLAELSILRTPVGGSLAGNLKIRNLRFVRGQTQQSEDLSLNHNK